MRQEDDQIPLLSQSVREFITAETSRRGLRRWETCASQLVREIGMAIELEGDDDFPSSPAEDSPDYSPVVHGARSDDELVDLLRSRIDSIGKGKWLTMDDLRAHEREIARRFGLDDPQATEKSKGRK